MNNYALVGRLVIGDDGKTLTQTSIPRLMNAYDEQAIEAALRFRDAGTECTIAVVCAGAESGDVLKHAAAMGADEIVSIPIEATTVDYHVMGDLLAAYVQSSGGADLVLCGRQASDDDQGVVPAILAERLDMPLVSIAREVALTDGGGVRVTRVTPDGDEIVECAGPAIVTISNELGTPRYPTMAKRMQARKKQPTVVEVASLGLADTALQPRVTLTKQFVPTVQSSCQMIEGASAAELADALVAKLREENVL